jgi:hypothetical protein
MRRKSCVVLCLAIAIAWCVPSHSQVTSIIIKAGSPEDLELQQIGTISDTGKRVQAYKDFVEKFAANAEAAAYGNWQLSQTLAADNHPADALTYGDKALALQPHNMEVLISQANTALQLKDDPRVFDYAARGGEVFNSIGSAPKPKDMSDSQYEGLNSDDRHSNQPSYEYMQALAYNVIAGEADAKKRMEYIQRFNGAFPDSKYQDQVAEYAILTLQSLADTSSAVSYGEMVLEQNPKNLPTLVMMASAYIENDKSLNLEKGISYARRAIDVANADDASADAQHKLSGGLAYAAVGYAYMKQKNEAGVPNAGAAIPELKHAAVLLKDNRNACAPILYELGRAYATLRRYDEAKAVLGEASQVPGPAQAPARELLSKILTARH